MFLCVFFGIAVGFAGLFFLLGREIVVVGSDSLCVELGHSFSIFGLGVVEGISGFFFFCVLVCCCRVGHTSTQSAF